MNVKLRITFIALVIIAIICDSSHSNNTDDKLSDILKIHWEIGMKWKVKVFDYFILHPDKNEFNYKEKKYDIIQYEVIDCIDIQETKLFVVKQSYYIPSTNIDNIRDPMSAKSDVNYMYYDLNNYELKYMSLDITNSIDRIKVIYKQKNLLTKGLPHYELYPEMSMGNYQSEKYQYIQQNIEIIENNTIKITTGNENVFYWKIGQPWWFKCEQVSHEKKFGDCYAATVFENDAPKD